ncbi:ArsR family transcriptional regulator [Streptomyces sp. NBC_01428]|uniref:ArsR family transcriptional regulator n=1 Tax=Streptomyces sp. NBC_01428 TaxID=2903861 RepID=UPI002E3513B6|nr:ArsR family transcriptional regulator [Streptomyces sp. NBC_01428]
MRILRLGTAFASDPGSRLRDIAATCDITERTAQKTVNDLEQAGYLRRERAGRRTPYTLCLDGSLRHPVDALVSVRQLLDICTQTRALRISDSPVHRAAELPAPGHDPGASV